MRNIKLTVEYDGTDFFGWQLQPGLRTVQDELESALSQVIRGPVRVIAAGRTDAGVHALGQVVNFKTESPLPIGAFLRGGNVLLPRDIRILNAEEVEPDFNARYSAVGRWYRYIISRRSRAIGRQYAWHAGYDLDHKSMQNAVSNISGDRDFASFCQSGTDVRHFRCNVYSADWRQEKDNLVFTIGANRFLHNMVRILVGTCVDIGRGHLARDAMCEILNARDRKQAGPTAPSHGLFLIRVEY